MRAVSQLWDTTDPYQPLYFADHYDADHYDAETVNAEHVGIVDAAFSHDVERTVRLLNLHRSDSVNRLRELLDSGS